MISIWWNNQTPSDESGANNLQPSGDTESPWCNHHNSCVDQLVGSTASTARLNASPLNSPELGFRIQDVDFRDVRFSGHRNITVKTATSATNWFKVWVLNPETSTSLMRCGCDVLCLQMDKTHQTQPVAPTSKQTATPALQVPLRSAVELSCSWTERSDQTPPPSCHGSGSLSRKVWENPKPNYQIWFAHYAKQFCTCRLSRTQNLSILGCDSACVCFRNIRNWEKVLWLWKLNLQILKSIFRKVRKMVI